MNQFLNMHYNDNNVDSFEREYFICVHSNGWVHSISHFDMPHNNVLDIKFDDVDSDGTKHVQWFGGTMKEITVKKLTIGQAKEIVEFIDNVPDDATLHIYCAKGKSRSTAIAKFAEEYRNNNTLDISHNQYVYNMLKEVNNV
jgi:predicted protein tyrosine phosphatase